MAYDTACDDVAIALPLPEPETAVPAWRMADRVIVLVGAVAFGAVVGFFAALLMGRVAPWMLAVLAIPALLAQLHLAGRTLSEAIVRNARICAIACTVHVIALFAWLLTSMLAPLTPPLLILAPTIGLSALVMFVACPAYVVYRTSLQGILVGALMAHLGVFILLGS